MKLKSLKRLDVYYIKRKTSTGIKKVLYKDEYPDFDRSIEKNGKPTKIKAEPALKYLITPEVFIPIL